MASSNPASRQTILVVCFGNLCRSPMGEALFRDRLDARRWRIISAGTHAVGDDPPTHGAAEAVLALAAIDISQQRSSALTVDTIQASDLIFTMSERQAREVAALCPDAAPNTRLLGAFAPASDHTRLTADPVGSAAGALEIADPMGEPQATYEACALRLIESVEAAANWIESGADPARAPASVAEWYETDRP